MNSPKAHDLFAAFVRGAAEQAEAAFRANLGTADDRRGFDPMAGTANGGAKSRAYAQAPPGYATAPDGRLDFAPCSKCGTWTWKRNIINFDTCESCHTKRNAS